MEFVVDQLIEFSAGKDEELRDISGLGTRPNFLHKNDSYISTYSVEDHHVGASS